MKQRLDSNIGFLQIYLDWIFNICILLLAVGIFYSRALLSVVPIILCVTGFWRVGIKESLQRFWGNKALLAISGFFVLSVLSGFNSENVEQWLENVKINAIMLLFPVGIAAFQPLRREKFYLFLYFYLFVAVFSVLLVLAQYTSNFEAFNILYSRGQTIATPVIHVRYALMISLAVFCGIYVQIKNYYLFFKAEKYWQLAMVIGLIVFLHILAVRTGLLSLYCGLFFSVIYFVLKQKKYVLGALILASLLGSPLLAYKFFPSFRNKLDYVVYDWGVVLNGSSSKQPSDYIRIHSIFNGLHLVQQQPLLGVGIGDLQQEMDKIYTQHQPNMPQEYRFPPINQIVTVLAAYGIVGLVFFLFCLFYPLYYQKNYRDYFFLCFYIVLVSSFVGETPLELQIGKSLYLYFALLGIVCLSPVATAEGSKKNDLVAKQEKKLVEG